MARVQPCRNGCDTNIVLQLNDGKWKPYEIDELGNPLDLHNCPKSPYNLKKGGGAGVAQKQQFYAKKPPFAQETTTLSATPSQGGSYLDTKRIRVMLEELNKKVDNIEHKLEYNTQIDTNKLIGQLQQVHDVIAPFLNTQGVVAADLLKDSKQLKIDPSTINHAHKADAYIEREQNNNTKFVDESKNLDLDERIPDDHDEMLASQYTDDNSNKGVIEEE